MKMPATQFWTSLVAAVATVVLLKFLKVFNFIKWSPIGWSKRYKLFTTEPALVKWVILCIAFFLLFLILYSISSWMYMLPPSVASILITLILIAAIEWGVHGISDVTVTEFLKNVSIPFAAILAVILRFVVGTSIYMKRSF